MRQIANALSPSNFVLTNPELLRETLTSNAENLVRGMHMLAEDIEAGGGHLKIRQSDSSMFAVGRNLATTPGKVIFQNEIMQLLQYAPSTEKVLKRPLLIVPPWINKYYVLDLTPEKSFIKWCVDQGITVFCISWVNPGRPPRARKPLRTTSAKARSPRSTRSSRRPAKTRSTPSAIASAARMLVGRAGGHGGAAATSASCRRPCSPPKSISPMPATSRSSSTRSRSRRSSSGWPSAAISKASRWSTVFNLLRSNDLIWPYVINNYLKGKAPFPFDLLYWNSDATRLPAANHSFYLRNCYLDNKLTKGKMTIGDTPIDLKSRQGADLQSRDARGPHRAGEIGAARLQIFRRAGALRAVRLRPYRRRGQPAGQAEISVLDRAEAAQRQPRRLARQGQGTSRLVVAGLARLAQAQDPTEVPARVPGDGALSRSRTRREAT